MVEVGDSGVVFRHTSVRLGGSVLGLSGTLCVSPTVAIVQTAKWLPRFLGGGTTVCQKGGTVELNDTHAGGRFIFTDGKRSAICGFGPTKTEQVCEALTSAGFVVRRMKRSILSAQLDFGLSKPAPPHKPTA